MRYQECLIELRGERREFERVARALAAATSTPADGNDALSPNDRTFLDLLRRQIDEALNPDET